MIKEIGKFEDDIVEIFKVEVMEFKKIFCIEDCNVVEVGYEELVVFVEDEVE